MYILQNMLFTKGDVSELAITLSSHEPQENAVSPRSAGRSRSTVSF